jgi:hypothetical protein
MGEPITQFGMSCRWEELIHVSPTRRSEGTILFQSGLR